MMTDYKPVTCELHSHLEDLIVIAKPVSLRWLDEDQKQFNETVKILNIYTRNHEEFIQVQINTETPFEIRLDRILI